MSLRAILYAYVLGGLTFIPLVILGVCFYAVYTSVPVGDPHYEKITKGKLEQRSQDEAAAEDVSSASGASTLEVNDLPKTRKGWLTVRRTFEETVADATYVGLVRGFLDARSKDPKRSRPKDMWYVVLKGKVLYLYEDENMTECEAAIELGSHDVVIYPEALLDGELFAKRNAICLKPKPLLPEEELPPSVTKEMVSTPDFADKVIEKDGSLKQKQKERERVQELEKVHDEARQEALDPSTPWFIFVRGNVEMEDWYLSLVHASDNPPHSPTLTPLQPVFQPADMLHLVDTLDEQPDVIPMRWLNALIGRLFFSYYRTKTLESYIIGRLMRKLSKIKRPGFLTDVVVREVSVGNRAPTFSKPMLKELTKEGDASLEVHLHYKGEVRITVEATATINLGPRFKSYTVKLVLAAVLREMEGNLLIKVKRPPSNRIWYAFTQMPRMVLDVEPVVSDRQITWSMILSTIESKVKEVILESVVMPNMDDIAFFESSAYKHRGGIWADASREERSSDILKNANEIPEEDRIPASAPASDTATPLATDLDPIGIQRSRSAPGEALTNSSPELDGLPMPRATTVPGGSASMMTSSSSARRRTWFNGAQGNASEASSSTANSEDFPDVIERGRTQAAAAFARRSSSTPSTPPQDSGSDSHTPRPREDTGDGESLLSPIPIRRSTSQHSQASSSQDTSASSSVENGPSESRSPSLRSKSPATSEKALPTSPTSTFFQTLKTRDKQAISNSAKEAMRKWGVNWGGLKKGDSAPKAEEGVDTDQRRDVESESKPRPNYGEVRAAVEQRKGTHGEGASTVPFELSEAVAVPRSQGKQRAPSVSSSSVSGMSVGNGASPSTSPRPGGSGLDVQGSPRSSSPALPVGSMARVRTISHLSQTGSDVASNAPPDEDEHPAEPIHTQPPPPKTMTIPGIHASHRGEVMSMGYAPPPPPPSEPKKTPAIQSVYRLWKNPGVQQGSSSMSGSPPETQVGFAGRDQDVSAGNAGAAPAQSEPPTSLTAPAAPAPPLPARPVPPPLPPRSHSTNALHMASEPPRHPPGLDRASPPATAALQSIVSKDNNKRASLDPSGSSPPRRETRASFDDPTTPTAAPSSDTNTDTVPTKPKPPALPPRRIAPPSA